MSSICFKCKKTVVLESQSSNKNKEDPSVDPEQVKKDFEELKEKLITLLSELGDKDIDLKLEHYNKNDIICEDCLDGIMLNFESEMNKQEMRRGSFQNELTSLNQEITKASKKLKELKFDATLEEKLKEQLKEVERAEEEQKLELKELEHIQIKTEEDVENYWEETMAFEKKLLLLNEKKSATAKQLKDLEVNQERLSKINVLNDIISISTEHEVAKVNDLQLGKTYNSSQVLNQFFFSSKIPWMETNAALGQLVLLFAILEQKILKFNFARLKMKPMGSFSEVIFKSNDGKETKYELYGAPKDETKFNYGLASMLEALCELRTVLESKLNEMIQGGVYEFPHPVVNDTIQNIQFKYNSSKLDKWTEVLKYFALNCKHLIYLYSLYEKNNQIAIKSQYE